MNLQKKTFFYVFIFVPLSFMIVLSKLNLISADTFAIGLFVYVFLYHPYISGLRLLKLHIIEKNQFLKNYIPFWNFKYFDVLFF